MNLSIRHIGAISLLCAFTSVAQQSAQPQKPATEANSGRTSSAQPEAARPAEPCPACEDLLAVVEQGGIWSVAVNTGDAKSTGEVMALAVLGRDNPTKEIKVARNQVSMSNLQGVPHESQMKVARAVMFCVDAQKSAADWKKIVDYIVYGIDSGKLKAYRAQLTEGGAPVALQSQMNAARFRSLAMLFGAH